MKRATSFVLAKQYLIPNLPSLQSLGILRHIMMSNFLNSTSYYGGGDGNQTSKASSFSTPPSHPPPPEQNYEVFLSFRGETRRGFVDHLYKRLVYAGISVFRDKEGLPLGEKNENELLEVIKTSRISIPIISPDYASSEWCLKELVQILKCKKSSSQLILPIFYRVKPTVVRKQSVVFEEESQVCNKRSHVVDGALIQEWRAALMEVSYLTGLVSEKIADGYEGDLVEMVVAKVLEALKKSSLVGPGHLVGVEDHNEQIMSVDVERSDDVRAILIHGMGIIGETTLAKVIMVDTVKFFIFAHGNIVRSEEGASYDRDPLRKIRLKTDARYKDLLNAICTGIKINPTTHRIEVHHRHPKSVEGRVHYLVVPILDDTDVETLIEMAEKMGEGSIQELYVEISDRFIALSEQETQQVDATMPSTS